MLFLLIATSFMWTVSGDSLFRGKIEGTIISADSVFTGNEIEEITEENSGFVSDIEKIEEKLYYSISDMGLLFSISNNEVDTVFDAGEGLINLGRRDNTLIAGLSPQGEVLFLDEGRIIDSLRLESDNIFSFVQWNGDLYVGTGPEGKIYAVDKENEASEFYSTDAASVVRMVTRENRLYAATSNPGLVYVFEEDDERIFYDPTMQEINGIGFCGDTLCVSGISNEGGTPAGVVKFYVDNEEFIVYKGTPVLSGEVRGNRFYAGESEDGQIGEFHRENLYIVADFEESKITRLKNTGGSLYAGTGYPSKIYKLTDKRRRKGKYFSPVWKGGFGVMWGKIFYEGSGDIDFQVRGGKKQEIDSSWTKWKEYDGSINVKEPFFQWRATIKGVESYLKKVNVSYREKNHPPDINKLVVLPPTIGYGGQASQVGQGKPLSHQEMMKLRKMGFFIPDQSYLIPEGIRCVYWESIDPDNDMVISELYLKREGDDYRKMASAIRENSFIFDTSPFPDGKYYIKLILSDAPNQPHPEKEESEAEFMIDHTPPAYSKIESHNFGDSIQVTGFLEDELSKIIGVYYKTDDSEIIAEWRSAEAVDGLFDEKRENFRFTVSKKSRYVAIRIVDRHSNSRVFRVKL